MDLAILIDGGRGIYIHEGPATLKENGGPSAGCVHVDKLHAKDLFDWITGRTRVTLTYPWQAIPFEKSNKISKKNYKKFKPKTKLDSVAKESRE